MSPNSYQKICTAVLRRVSDRQKEVLERRFGLRKKEPETLESIGKDFGITRERVRQIEADALKKIAHFLEQEEGIKLVQNVFDNFLSHLKQYGGLRKEETLLEELGKPAEKYPVRFLLTIGNSFEHFGETEDTYSVWTSDRNVFSVAQQVINSFLQLFEKLGKPVEAKKLLLHYQKEIKPALNYSLQEKAIFSYLGIAKKISVGPHGLYGLSSWPEITPRSLRDRAYLVYQKEKRPLHFTQVAKLIEQHGFGPEGRPVSVQSVHNDLIRDPRFVLIGRGIYALQEWGYTSGKVSDIIAKVLERLGKPMTKKEIAEQVLKHRLVKENTIFLNLQNKKYFQKTPDGKYTLKTQLA